MQKATVKRRPPSTHKKVVVRKLDKSLVRGYVDPRAYLSADAVELLEHEGRLVGIPLCQIKAVFFVRDFEGNRQHPERKSFRSRPRQSGLWVRMIFKDSEILEGLMPNNLLEIDPSGFYITPPDVYSNNLQVFVPRNSLAEMEVLGVINYGKLRREQLQAGGATGEIGDINGQIGLFGSSGAVRRKVATKH